MAEKNKDPLDLGKEQEAKPSKLMLYIVILLVVVVLGLAGGLLYVMGVFGKPEAAAEAEHVEEAPPPPQDPIYLPLDKDLVVNLPAGGDARLLQVGITVLLFDPTLPDYIKKHMPQLRNNINVLLASQDAAQLRKPEGKQALQAAILAEVNKVVQQQSPTAKVEQVFFTSFILQ